MKPNKILSLDISSTCTGFAVLEKVNKLLTCGTLKMMVGPPGLCLTQFELDLKNLIRKHKPSIIVAEDIFKGPNIKTYKTLSYFQGILLKVCSEAQLPVKLIPVSTIRKALSELTGNKIKTKKDAFEAIKDVYGLDITFTSGNDITDAIAAGLAC